VYKKIENGKTTYQVLPVDEFQYKKHFFKQAKDFEQMLQFTNHVRKLLQKHNLNVTEKKTFNNNPAFLMREVFVQGK
jgi:hypothetical protein